MGVEAKGQPCPCPLSLHMGPCLWASIPAFLGPVSQFSASGLLTIWGNMAQAEVPERKWRQIRSKQTEQRSSRQSWAGMRTRNGPASGPSCTPNLSLCGSHISNHILPGCKPLKASPAGSLKNSRLVSPQPQGQGLALCQLSIRCLLNE